MFTWQMKTEIIGAASSDERYLQKAKLLVKSEKLVHVLHAHSRLDY